MSFRPSIKRYLLVLAAVLCVAAVAVPVSAYYTGMGFHNSPTDGTGYPTGLIRIVVNLEGPDGATTSIAGNVYFNGLYTTSPFPPGMRSNLLEVFEVPEGHYITYIYVQGVIPVASSGATSLRSFLVSVQDGIHAPSYSEAPTDDRIYAVSNYDIRQLQWTQSTSSNNLWDGYSSYRTETGAGLMQIESVWKNIPYGTVRGDMVTVNAYMFLGEYPV